MTSRLLRVLTAAFAAGVVAATLGATVPGPAGAQTSTTTTTTSAGTSSSSSSTRTRVEVGDNFYKPERIEVPVGTRVTWKNEGKILHNVVPVKGKAWGTRSLVTGKSYSYRFKKPGTYAYYCTFHGSPTSGQRGSVVVTAAASGATTTTTAR